MQVFHRLFNALKHPKNLSSLNHFVFFELVEQNVTLYDRFEDLLLINFVKIEAVSLNRFTSLSLSLIKRKVSHHEVNCF